MTSPRPFYGHAFDADTPKLRVDEDRYDVLPFLRRLRGPLLRAPVEHSIVLGLYAPWGYGKSTALNFLDELLWEATLPENRPQIEADVPRVPQPIIVRFTPWLYADVEALLASFFETMSHELAKHAGLSTTARRQVAEGLNALAAFVAPAAKLGALAAGPGWAPAAPVAAGLGIAVAGAMRGTATAISRAEQDFRSNKALVAKALLEVATGDAPRRVIVLIDDLDRAAPPEILAMLKLVRLVADLPNVSYLIALDDERVATALSSELKSGTGREFLEKIVQVGVTMPTFARDALVRALLEQAQAIVAHAGLSGDALAVDWFGWETFDSDGLAGHLRRALSTPRDVARILNAFRFALLTSNERAELHPADLLLLCVLHAKWPAHYKQIREHRRFLLHAEWESSMGTDKAESIRAARVERFASLLEAAGQNAASIARDRAFLEASSATRALKRGRYSPAAEILLELFPQSIEPSFPEHDLARARRESRIATREFFAAYFRFDQPDDVLEREEIQRILDQLLSDDFSNETAVTLVHWGAALSDEIVASLRQGVADASADLTRADAKALQRALPMLAAARVPRPPSGSQLGPDEPLTSGPRTGAEPRFPASILLDLTVRVAVEMRIEPQESASSIDLITSVAEGLSHDDAADLLELVARNGTRALELTAEEIVIVAIAGLPRAAADVQSRFPDAAAVRRDGRAFSESVWRWRRLATHARAASSDAVYPPIRAHVDALLVDDPLVVCEIIALAANWSPDTREATPGFSSGMGEVRRVIARITDPEVVSATARTVMESGKSSQTRWPYLVEQYVS